MENDDTEAVMEARLRRQWCRVCLASRRVEHGTRYSRRRSKIGGAEVTDRDDRRQDEGPLGDLGEENRHG